MFVSAETVSGEYLCLNVSHILLITKAKKKPNAIVLTVDGDSFELVESYEDFCKRLEQSSYNLLRFSN